jgi:hypothetical protein
MALDHAKFLSKALSRGVPLDAALSALRRNGATPIDSIKAVREVCGVSLGEAKKLVADSPTWDDIRDAHDRLVEDLISFMEADTE